MKVDVRQVKDHFSKHNNSYIDAEREKLYDTLTWELHEIPLAELGIWDEAHGMPHEWCIENMLETIEKYRKAKNHDGIYHTRIQHFLNKRKFGAVIAICGRTKRGREECSETKWSIDDGCMRVMALGLKGFNHIQCYLGVGHEN